MHPATDSAYWYSPKQTKARFTPSTMPFGNGHWPIFEMCLAIAAGNECEQQNCAQALQQKIDCWLTGIVPVAVSFTNTAVAHMDKDKEKLTLSESNLVVHVLQNYHL